VFLFDVVRLGVDCIERGLAEVFQSSQITKVLHDCRRTSHILFHQFCITLSNIFDTQVTTHTHTQQSNHPTHYILFPLFQVTDLFIRKNETSEMPSHVRSLPDCLADYLGLAEDETCLVSKGHSMVNENTNSIWR
jgi:ribonuclease D